MDQPHASPPALLFIEGELTLRRACELKERLLVRLARAQVLEVDLADVTEMDAAGLQLLLMVRREARASGREVRLVSPSPAVLSMFSLLGLASSLEGCGDGPR
jgi:anti-anti-sigma factor